MHNKLVIIGAGGHGKVVADIALKIQKYKEIVFLDDNENVKECLGFPIVGKSENVEQYIEESDFFVAIGNGNTRKRVTEYLVEQGANVISLIHPSAAIGSGVTIGKGTVVMAGVVINSDAKIGQGCIINTCSSVDHDCALGNYVHVAVGAHICGTVNVGENTWIGAGAIVKNNVDVCNNCMIGAGTVVIKDIKEVGTYVGSPAKKIK